MKIDLSRLNSAIDNAFAATVQDVATAAQKALSAKRWRWSGATVRRSGEIAGSPRNIIDTGVLYRSQQVKNDRKLASISYDVKYAAIVHRDRPWLSTALDETDAVKTFAKHLRRNLS